MRKKEMSRTKETLSILNVPGLRETATQTEPATTQMTNDAAPRTLFSPTSPC